jgi:hypothetical protein
MQQRAPRGNPLNVKRYSPLQRWESEPFWEGPWHGIGYVAAGNIERVASEIKAEMVGISLHDAMECAKKEYGYSSFKCVGQRLGIIGRGGFSEPWQGCIRFTFTHY